MNRLVCRLLSISTVLGTVGLSYSTQLVHGTENTKGADSFAGKQGYVASSAYSAASEPAAAYPSGPAAAYPSGPGAAYPAASEYPAASAYQASQYDYAAAVQGEYQQQAYNVVQPTLDRSETSLASLSVVFTAFAAAFLGSLVAPLLTSGLNRMIGTVEFTVPDIELPRI